jgi:L-ascorbate metabolism protein UlaG (beta-lactamase superfamily)
MTTGPSIWFRWLGVAGIELRLDDHTLVIDPFLTRPPIWRMWFGRLRPDRELIAQKIPTCDHVLVTHAHWDHLMDVPEVLRQTDAVALGSPNVCRLLQALGVPREQIREIGAGDRFTLGPFHVGVLRGEHTKILGRVPYNRPLPQRLEAPLRLRDYCVDECFCFLIEAAGRRLLDWGSVRAETAVRADMLFTGPEQDTAYYKILLGKVRPRVVVPTHWDDFFRPLSRPLRPFFKPPAWTWPPLQRMNPARLKRTIERIAPGTNVLVPEVFRLYDLSSASSSSAS